MDRILRFAQMDRILRFAQQAFRAEPESIPALLSYWSALLRSGRNIDLADLTPAHAITDDVGRFLTTRSETIFNDRRAILSLAEPLPGFPGSILNPMCLSELALAAMAIYYQHLIDDVGDDFLSEQDILLEYVGIMPNLYTMHESMASSLIPQTHAPGLVLLMRSPMTRYLKVAAHFSCYTDIVGLAIYESIGQIVDLEATFMRGEEHLALLRSRSCNLGATTYPITLLHFETVNIPTNSCFPLIDVYRNDEGISLTQLNRMF